MHGEVKRYWLANYREHLNGEWQKLDVKTNRWDSLDGIPDCPLLWPIENGVQLPWIYHTDRSQETDANGFWMN